MMETANLGDLNDRPLGHDGALDGTLLIERQMNARTMIVAKVRSQYPLQVTSAQNNQVIHTFSANRADEALRVRILPGTLRCGEDFFNL